MIGPIHTPRGPAHGFETDIRNIEEWEPTPAQVRDAILRLMVVGNTLPMDDLHGLPPFARDFMPTQRQVEAVAGAAREAIRAGRLIDFGHLPNAVIIEGGDRGGTFYHKGVLPHPFRDPYLFMHSWDQATSIYLVTPMEPDTPGGDVEVTELAPVMAGSMKTLTISDRVLLVGFGEKGQYHSHCIPSFWRYLAPDHPEHHGQRPEQAAAGNCLDPLMTALMILSTKGIPRETIAAPDKLQRARRKSGKPPIPPYELVHTEGYVTALLNRGTLKDRSLRSMGTHASPEPHLRRGHLRVYASGRTSYIADTLVNFSFEAREAFRAGTFFPNRTHYTARGDL